MIYRDLYRTSYSFEFVDAKLDAMSTWQTRVKRGIDILFSAIGLVVLSPVMLFIYILLKLKGEKQVIYSQERIGLHGEPFTIYKFKTFRDDAELDGPQLSTPGDTRITPLGKRLREHHLDELPQLWNVLKGDMSMVGPRPERKYFIDKTGNIVIEVNKWVETGDFYEGLCYVRDKNGKWGFINKSGEIVIPCQYQGWGNFKNGKARVEDENGKEIYIDKNGNVIH